MKSEGKIVARFRLEEVPRFSLEKEIVSRPLNKTYGSEITAKGCENSRWRRAANYSSKSLTEGPFNTCDSIARPNMRRGARGSFAILGLLCAAALAGCGTDFTVAPLSPAANSGHRLRTAAARNSATTDMTVTSASPDSATQDTTLDVVITGSGFVQGTVATWAFAGTPDSAQVRTNSTRYISSRQLVANITISASATLGKWDIVVSAAGSKGGIGTEAFTIKIKGNVDTHSRVRYSLANQVEVGGALQPAGIVGDGRLATGVSAGTSDSEYQGEYCGVTGTIANESRESGDLSYDPDAGQTSFCGAARYYVFNLDGVPTHIAPLSRVFALWSLGVGESADKGQGFGVQLPNCGVLFFSRDYGVDDLRVTRIDGGTGPRQWIIRSQGSHMAACANLSKKGAATYIATGKKYYLPFAISVVEVPYPYGSFP